MNLAGKIESLLFVASRPMTAKKIGELLHAEVDEVTAAIGELQQQYNVADRGIQIAQHALSVQMVTSPLHARIVADFLKDERSGELTRPSLETLTIVAYRGPLPKSEIDLIRGVNCALILRNLLIRGLITSREDADRMAMVYEISFDFLRHLGLRNVTELPDYARLHDDPQLDSLLHPKLPPNDEDSTKASAGQTTSGETTGDADGQDDTRPSS